MQWAAGGGGGRGHLKIQACVGGMRGRQVCRVRVGGITGRGQGTGVNPNPSPKTLPVVDVIPINPSGCDVRPPSGSQRRGVR